MSTGLPDALAGYQTDIEESLAKAGLKWHEQHDLPAYMHNARTAISELQQQAEAARALLNDQRYASAHRLETADKMRAEQEKKVKAVLAAVEQAAEAVRTKLQDAWKPKAPKNLDTNLLLARREDFIRLLDAQSGEWPQVAEQAARLFGEAVSRGDELAAYALAGEGPGTLDLYYLSRGITPEAAGMLFAQAAGTLRPELAAITAPGGALAAFQQSARYQVARTVASMKQDADTVAMEQIGQAAAHQTFGW